MSNFSPRNAQYQGSDGFVQGTDQRSPGPTEYLRGKVDPPPSTDNAANMLADDASNPSNTSPKLRLKFHRFWSGMFAGTHKISLKNFLKIG